MDNKMEEIEIAKKVMFWFEENRYTGKRDCPYQMTLEEARKIAEEDLIKQCGREQYIL